MAHKLAPMDLKQIIRLHLGGLSNRKIAGLLGIGSNTVNTYMRHKRGAVPRALHLKSSPLAAGCLSSALQPARAWARLASRKKDQILVLLEYPLG